MPARFVIYFGETPGEPPRVATYPRLAGQSGDHRNIQHGTVRVNVQSSSGRRN